MVWTGSIWHRIGTSGGPLWTRWWTFGFHKMLGSSWVAAQLAASQEGLSSINEWMSEWVIYKCFHIIFYTVVTTAGRPGLDSRPREEIFLSSTASIPPLGPTQTPIQWDSGAFPPGIKLPEFEADHSLPSRTEVKNGGVISPFPPMSSWYGA
jgi:hypothetical protein